MKGAPNRWLKMFPTRQNLTVLPHHTAIPRTGTLSKIETISSPPHPHQLVPNTSRHRTFFVPIIREASSSVCYCFCRTFRLIAEMFSSDCREDGIALLKSDADKQAIWELF
jgi:hypothetical protein